MQIDDVINKTNSKYFFKIIAFLILSFPTFQYYGQMQNVLLAIVTPNHTCITNASFTNTSMSNDQCLLNVEGSEQKCKKWNFSLEPVGTTMISDYGLVCDKKEYGDIILIVWYMSSFTSFLMGWLSDKYGRKKITIINLTIEIISSILLSVTPNILSNIILRFFLGVSSCSVYITFVWLMESVNTDFRRFVGSFFWLYGCIAYMIFPGIVNATRNWRHTQLYSIIPSLFYICIFFIPESPRWLFVVGKRNKGVESLDRISKINGLKLNFEDTDIEVSKVEKEADIRGAWKSSVFIQRSILTFFLQFSTAILYSGVTVNIGILNKNVLLSIFLLGLMETPGLILSYFTLQYLKRKFSIILFGLLGVILFWVNVFLNQDIYWQSIIVIMFGCIGKSMVASVNQTTMVYIAELFPTSHRSFAFVCVQFSNFLSFVSAVYINKLSNIHMILPMSIYLILMIVSCILTYFMLPETKGLPFPETLEDQKELIVGREQTFIIYMNSKSTDHYTYYNVMDDAM